MLANIDRTASDIFDSLDLIIGIGVPIVLLALGLSIGRFIERRHLARLAARRAVLGHMLVTDIKNFPLLRSGDASSQHPPQLVVAEATVAADYLKTFFAGLRKIVGGELRSYQNLMFRAREEATLRLMEAAQAQGFDSLCNLRLETADIGGASVNNKAKATFVSILASATAYRRSE